MIALFLVALTGLQGRNLGIQARAVEGIGRVVDLIFLAITGVQQKAHEVDQLGGGMQAVVSIDPLQDRSPFPVAFRLRQAPGGGVQGPHQRQRGKVHQARTLARLAPIAAAPLEPVKQATRIVQVPANLVGQRRLVRFRQQRIPGRPGLEQALGGAVEPAQHIAQGCRHLGQAVLVELLAVHAHQQVEGVLLGHMDGRRMSGRPSQAITPCQIRLGRITKGRSGRWQRSMRRVSRQLIEMMGLGRQPVAHQ